jgi:hypothetical protein
MDDRTRKKSYLAFLILENGVSPVSQQQCAELGPAFLGSLVKRGEAPLVGGYKRELCKSAVNVKL